MKPVDARSTAAAWRWCAALGLMLVLGMSKGAAAEGIVAFGAPLKEGFEAHCKRGEVLTGLWVGEDFAALNPQCAMPSDLGDKNRGVLEGWYQGSGAGWDPSYGGAQGIPCPDIAPMLLSIRITTQSDTDLYSHQKSFHFLKLETFCGVDGSHPSREQRGGQYVKPGPLGEGALGGGTQFCPAGQVAVGIRGHFYSALDQLGLICGDPKLGSRGQPPNLAHGKVDTNSKAGATAIAPGSPPVLNAAPVDPRRKNPGAATLTPQSLATNPTAAASAAAALDAATRNQTGHVQLKPQPLPPGGALQAPGSLR